MNEDNRELLADVISDRLNTALNGANEDERSGAFEEAMQAIDRSTNIAKQDDSFQEHTEKLAVEKEQLEEAKKEKRRNFWIKTVEVGVTLLVGVGVPLICDYKNRKFKEDFARECMEFESNGGMFTSTPGKSTRDFLRHK